MTRVPAPRPILTVGHSTHAIEELLAILKAHGVALVADVRTVPRSRHNPQFDRAVLPASLEAAGIAYRHLPALGGLRHPRPDSPNLGWRNASFRGFADYLQTPGFERGLAELIAAARAATTAIMCAEALPWRCHRSLIADALLVRGIRVEHIMSATHRQPHALTPFARVTGTRLDYPEPAPAPTEQPRP